MQTAAGTTSADKQVWYNAHESLKKGITVFKHLSTVKSGHFIMLEEPQPVINNIRQLLSQLP